MSSEEEQESAQGVYGISVTADLVGTGVQNLRLYERRGLVQPSRTAGGTRLYSRDDVTRLGRITDLLAAGLNLAGIGMVLDLQDDLARAETTMARQQTASPAPQPEPVEGPEGITRPEPVEGPEGVAPADSEAGRD